MSAPHKRSDEQPKSRIHDLEESNVEWLKSVNGIETKVLGGSHIFNNTHITQLEAVSSMILLNFVVSHLMHVMLSVFDYSIMKTEL